MRRRMRAPLTLAAATALALPLAAAPAHADDVSPDDPGGLTDVAPDHRSFAESFAEAFEQAQQAAPRTLGGPAGPGATRKQLDAVLADAADNDPVVGVTGRVDVPGTHWRGADGNREVGGRAPARPYDAFRVGSITKPMVATLVLQEVERGTWTLDTPVVDVLPAAADVVPEKYQDAVTLETLLSHTSGLPDHLSALLLSRIEDPTDLDQQFAAMEEEYTKADHLAAMNQPWLFEPGTDWTYSNAGYVLLGLALEQATGHDLDDLLQWRVFWPAHMWRTDLPDDPGTRGPFLEGAAYTGDLGAGWYPQDGLDPSLFGAAGAVTSTTADLQKFTDALLDGDLLETQTVDDMLTPRDAAAQYGLGVLRVADPCNPAEFLYGHDGATFGTFSITLTSRDGDREYTAGLSGRDYTVQQPTDLAEAIYGMIDATC